MAALSDVQHLLSMPGVPAVRQHAHALIEKLTIAAERLAYPEDREALHDFRVALRRLRVWLQTYGQDIHVSDKLLSHLGDMMHVSNRARDTEVALPWLEAQRPTLNDRHLPGLNWLVAHVEEERKYACEIIASHLADEWASRARKLKKRLTQQGRPQHAGSFGQLAGRQLVRCLDELTAHLDDVRSIADLAAAHRARISVAHLRYLLEPLRAEVSELDPIIARLTALQDQFGALNDAGLLLDRLIDGTETAAMEGAKALLHRVLKGDLQEAQLCGADFPDIRCGLFILTHRAKQRETELFYHILDTLQDDDTTKPLEETRIIGASLVTAYGAR